MNMPVIIIRLYIENSNQNIQKVVFQGLQKHLKEISGDATIKLAHQEAYWKHENWTECIYHIFNHKWIPIQEIMAKFNLDWEFVSSEAYTSKNDVVCKFPYEEALWDRRFDSKCFVHENVKWVSIEDNYIDLDVEYN